MLASLTVLRQVRMSSLATINYDSINTNACFDLRSEMPNGNPKCNQAHTDIYIRTRYSMYKFQGHVGSFCQCVVFDKNQ